MALTVGKAGGGTASNIIPDTAEIAVGVRTFDKDVRAHLLKRVPEIIDHTVKMWRGNYDLTDFHTPSTYTDFDLCEEMLPFIEEITGDGTARTVPCSAGTEDFGYVTEKVPGMLIYLGTGGGARKTSSQPRYGSGRKRLKTGSGHICKLRGRVA